jgi:hypothetical protein
MRANVLNGSGVTVVRSGLGRAVRDIKIFDKERQPGNYPLYLKYLVFIVQSA